MTAFTTTPVFVTLHVDTEYTVSYRLNPWDTESRIDGTLSRLRVAPLNGDSNSGSGFPMLGFKPREGKELLVEVPWEAITSISLYRDWNK